jgi:hypothetical protein
MIRMVWVPLNKANRDYWRQREYRNYRAT